MLTLPHVDSEGNGKIDTPYQIPKGREREAEDDAKAPVAPAEGEDVKVSNSDGGSHAICGVIG